MVLAQLVRVQVVYVDVTKVRAGIDIGAGHATMGLLLGKVRLLSRLLLSRQVLHLLPVAVRHKLAKLNDFSGQLCVTWRCRLTHSLVILNSRPHFTFHLGLLEGVLREVPVQHILRVVTHVELLLLSLASLNLHLATIRGHCWRRVRCHCGSRHHVLGLLLSVRRTFHCVAGERLLGRTGRRA